MAVGQIDGGDTEAEDVGLQIARLLILILARQAALHLDRLGAPREDGDAVEPLLPVEQRAIARGLDLGGRDRLVARFQFLQTGDVGLGFPETFDQARQACLRSGERRVGKEYVNKCSIRWLSYT